MKTRLSLIATGVVAAAALFTASFALAGADVATLHLTAKDNNKSFTVQRHSVIVVKLKDAGWDGGYGWTRGYSSGVKRVRYHTIAARSPHHIVGGGVAKQIWRFKVVGPKGEGEIQFRYVSPARKVVRKFVVGLRIG